MKRIVVAITGASGVVIGKRLVESLKTKENRKKHQVHLIVSEAAKEIGAYEEAGLDKAYRTADRCYAEDDLWAQISSSSYRIDAMAIAPCSMKTLASVANGFSDNLIVRSAENALKMGKPLVLAPRDTPLSLAALENMAKLKAAGALICPPVMAYYHKPKTVDEATDFFVGKILDCLGIEHKLYKRWSGAK